MITILILLVLIGIVVLLCVGAYYAAIIGLIIFCVTFVCRIVHRTKLGQWIEEKWDSFQRTDGK